MKRKAGRHLVLKYWGRRLQTLVKAAINEADPIVLIRVGAPDDEYDPEIADIVAQLIRLDRKPTNTEVSEMCRSVFDEWFGGISRDEDAIDRMAATIVERWDESSPPGKDNQA